MAATKRARLDEESPKKEKEPKLKCHEMRLIFQRLPTSELIRFVSRQPKQPLGKFWSQELKFVIEKRLPFSIKATVFARSAHSNHVIYDCNGSRVAEIRRPECFHRSHICELIEIAEVPAIARIKPSLTPRFMFSTSDILSALTNLDTLVLSAHYFSRPKMRGPVDLATALSPELMSRIKSLTLASDDYGEQFAKPVSEILPWASNLKSLCLRTLHQETLLTCLAALSNVTEGYFGLESLILLHLEPQSLQPFLEIIMTRFKGLRELFLPVRGPIRLYLAAFQALPGLTTLGLSACYFDPENDEKEMPNNENGVSVASVTELFISGRYLDSAGPEALLALLSKFPKVRTFGADFNAESLLRLASAVCSSGVFVHLQALKLFSVYFHPSVSRDALLQFIRANIDHLPSSVDLSCVKTGRPTNVDRDFLVGLSLMLQSGIMSTLALEDLVHREAVSRLRAHFALLKQETNGSCGKVVAWIDEGSIGERRFRSQAAWWPKAVSDFTDFRIEAYKTSGPLKGSTFNVRISNWSGRRKRLLYDKMI